MRVAITAQIKNGWLYEAVKILGSQAALAKFLGVWPNTIGEWLHFRRVPAYLGNETASESVKRQYEEWDKKFVELIGVGLDDVFPEEVRRNATALRHMAKLEAIKEMPVEKLIECGAVPSRLLQSPEQAVAQNEFKDQIQKALNLLTPREEKVIKMRFGLGESGREHALHEVGKVLRVTSTRVRQIECKALGKLRHPKRSRVLREFLND